MNNYIKRSGYYYAMGSFLGYPSCCTEEWIENNPRRNNLLLEQKYINNSFRGTGFIPCHKCLEKDKNELISQINSNRTFKYPFPFSGSILDTAGVEFDEYFTNFKQ